MVESEGKPLSQLFADTHSLAQEAEQTPDRETQKRLQERALSTVNDAIARVETSAIFSLNEELEDVPTADLRYLLLPAMRGDLLQGLVTSSRHQRRVALLSARQSYSNFLRRLWHYKALGGDALAAAEDYLDGLNQEEDGEYSTKRPDPGTLRQRKIAFFKRRKALDQLLRSNTTQTSDEDDHTQRNRWVLQLEDAALRVLDSLPAMDEEFRLLEHATVASKDKEQLPIPKAETEQRKRDVLKGIHGVLAGLQQGERERMRANVFKPSHILPTMTVEQFGELEAAAARERATHEEAQQKAEMQRKAELASDDEEEDNRVKHKARAMDDWLDANPKGWGNSKLRPCG